ncbi:MAG: nucleoside triphosphate pyrophosphohydrolase [Oscillospiraceae bacterium]|nr:nucleoside triphosphate pyrophosphohydrolase [Oscillospiraceae bacterium]
MVPFTRKEKYDFNDFREIIAILRHPGGCPWDMEQDHHSIRRNFIEEVYEACEGIDQENTPLLREELGDVLMQVLFHASIEEDAGRFNIDDVCDEAVKKLIFRHPHVFGTAHVETIDGELNLWDDLKRQEKGQESYTDTLNSVAKTLPALWRAEKVQKKAAKAGFTWPNVEGALKKVDEEAAELREAVANGTNITEELGDLLMATVAAARQLGIDPEDALNQATDKYIARFQRVEEGAIGSGHDMKELPLPVLEELWKQAKHQEEPHEQN